MYFFKQYQKYFYLLGGIIILIGFGIYYYINSKSQSNNEIIIADEVKKTTTVITTTKSGFYVDVKGAIAKPGVYFFSEGDKVIDAINIAGGLTKNATTSNINLSQKLKSEMVVYVFTKYEIMKTTTTTQVCKCETFKVESSLDKENESTNDKININTADVTKLMTLSGIGEAKAKAIIAYRDSNGLFKTIEDIKNVSGIGDNLYNQIKDNITV